MNSLKISMQNQTVGKLSIDRDENWDLQFKFTLISHFCSFGISLKP